MCDARDDLVMPRNFNLQKGETLMHLIKNESNLLKTGGSKR
jgi:uncharacterized cupredoxin-like copper-binding protein